MSQQLFQSVMARTATLIWAKEIEIDTLKSEIKVWRQQGEASLAVQAGKVLGKERSKLRKLVALQVATKIELQTVYRKERIAKLYPLVFGSHAIKAQYTSVEQLAMLEALYAEKLAHEAVVAVTAYE